MIATLLTSTTSTLPPLPCALGNGYTACTAAWEFVGPASYRDGSKDPDGGGGLPAASAIEAVAGPTTTGQHWFVGTVNGGVWRTEEASLLSARPVWLSATDHQPVRCSSISALAVLGDTVLAGCGGSTSSEMGTGVIILNDGDWGGVMLSKDAGLTWAMTSFPVGFYVSKIVAMSPEVMLVAARSSFTNEDDGGVWRSSDGGTTWTRVLSLPTFDLVATSPSPPDDPAGTVFAAIALEATSTVLKSVDSGLTFSTWSRGLNWSESGRDYIPFYPCLALGEGGPLAANSTVLFLGALTVDPFDSRSTNSKVFWRPLDADPREDTWVQVGNAPRLDDDSMPKDRMALLSDPTTPGTLYVAGNGDQIAYRVDWHSGTWIDLTLNDTIDHSSPHCDCRNFAWISSSSSSSSSSSNSTPLEILPPSLLLVSDGGVWRRTLPAQRGAGQWLSANGDIGAMEILSASWDAALERWIGGAQDNDVQLAPPGTDWNTTASGIVMGDGTLTAVDNTVAPARLFGTRQFLGQRDIDGISKITKTKTTKDVVVVRTGGADGAAGGGADAPGFMFAAGSNPPRVVGIPIEAHFPDAEAFPYFVMPWTLNSQSPGDLVVWVNGTRGVASAFYQYAIPHHANVTSAEIPPPTKLVESGFGGTVLDFVAGGFTAGKSDPSVLVAMNNTHLYHRSAAAATMTVRKLPSPFAAPVILTYDAEGNVVLGPLSHGQTVHLAVSPADSSTVVVTGWPSTKTNDPSRAGAESIWLSTDSGMSWVDVIGNLVTATSTISMARPSGLLLLPLSDSTALLVGTVSGVFVSWLDAPRRGKWSRLGTCADLPLVLTMGLSYEHFSDTILAATMGRGVYRLPNASSALLQSRSEQSGGGCGAPAAAQQAASIAGLFAPRKTFLL